MPYIQTKVNVKIEKDQEERIKTKLGEAIAFIPGKSESWLMLGFEDECSLYFKGSDQKPIAFVEVKLFGKASGEAYNKLTATITDILQEELGISSDCCYVKYEEVANWGWNGSNF